MKRDTLQKKIDEKGAAYRASTDTVEREKLSTELREIQVQLQDTLSEGANACPDGKDHRVIGMLKRVGYYDGRLEMDVPEQWEVGCITCPPVLVERENGTELNGKKVRRWSHSARGTTPEEAVKNWNSGKWVEDAQIARVPSQKIFVQDSAPAMTQEAEQEPAPATPKKTPTIRKARTKKASTARKAKADVLADGKIDDEEGIEMGSASESPVEKVIKP